MSKNNIGIGSEITLDGITDEEVIDVNKIEPMECGEAEEFFENMIDCVSGKRDLQSMFYGGDENYSSLAEKLIAAFKAGIIAVRCNSDIYNRLMKDVDIKADTDLRLLKD